MANLRVNNVVGFGSTDAGVNFTGPIKLNTQGYMYFPTGVTTDRGRGRAVLFGGSITPVSPNFSSNIDYVEMRSSGVGVRFGSLSAGNSFMGSFSSSTRGISFGGQPSSPNGQTDTIEFVTISTESNATDFGNLDRGRRQLQGMGHSNQTRGILAGGGGDAPLAPDNVIQFVTIATTGNASDFGDVSTSISRASATGSSTRMLIAGGSTPTVINTIQFVTIATTGNPTDFGDLSAVRMSMGRASNGVRGVFAGGYTPSLVNIIEFVNVATTGNTTDFGDFSTAKSAMGSANNSIIGIFQGGATPSRSTTIQSITIATTGDAVEYGDCNITDPLFGREGCSDSHGGLSE